MSAMVPTTLEDIIRDLYHRHADLERRLANKKRTGLITDVDEQTGLVRVDLGEDPVTGEIFKSPWIPVLEIGMGALRTSFLPTEGEQVEVLSENGDLTDAMVGPSLPSDKHPRPHDKKGEGKIQVGEKTWILIQEGKITFKVGGTSIVITEGQIKHISPHIDLESNRIDHRNKNTVIIVPVPVVPAAPPPPPPPSGVPPPGTT